MSVSVNEGSSFPAHLTGLWASRESSFRTPNPSPEEKLSLGSLAYAHCANRKFFPNNWSHTKNSKAKHEKTALPPPSWSCQETSRDNCPCSDFSILWLVFFSLCFIFSIQMEKCTRQSSSHLDPLAPQRCHPTPCLSCARLPVSEAP